MAGRMIGIPYRYQPQRFYEREFALEAGFWWCSMRSVGKSVFFLSDKGGGVCNL